MIVSVPTTARALGLIRLCRALHSRIYAEVATMLRPTCSTP